MAFADMKTWLVDKEHTENNWIEAWPLIRKDTAAGHHAVELKSVDEEHLVLAMEIDDGDRQPMGLLHGGVSMMLAETAASMHSCWDLDLSEEFPVGIEINGSHMRSATKGWVEARAQRLRKSSTLIHHRVEIVEQATERVLSTIRVTNLIRRHRSE